MNKLKTRIQQDKAFFTEIFTKAPADEALALVRENYPEALHFDAARQRITFSAPTDGWFRWLDYAGGALKYTAIYVPGKEDDE